MPDIYEFLPALHQGVWEVVIPKDLLTVPLGPEWKFSPINVPSHETIASYRNGQYHMHVTNDEYRIHLDRYDPEKNPFLHLIDDAPLVLMIYETLETLYITARDAKKNPGPDFIQDQRLTWKFRIILGIGLLATAGILGLIALEQNTVLFSTLLPAIVFIGGILVLMNGLIMQRRNEYSRKDIMNGLLIIVGAILMSLLWVFYLAIILLILAIWFFGSAVVTIKRVLRDKTKIPQGFWLSMGMGLGSLAFGGLTIIAPDILLEILVGILAAIVGIIGFGFFMDGYGLRNAEHLMSEHHQIQR